MQKQWNIERKLNKPEPYIYVKNASVSFARYGILTKALRKTQAWWDVAECRLVTTEFSKEYCVSFCSVANLININKITSHNN
jgi:hypothetical protein